MICFLAIAKRLSTTEDAFPLEKRTLFLRTLSHCLVKIISGGLEEGR